MEQVIGYWKEVDEGFQCSICSSLSSRTSPYCPDCGTRLIKNELKDGEYIVTNQQIIFEHEIHEDCTVVIVTDPFTGEKCLTWFDNVDEEEDDYIGWEEIDEEEEEEDEDV